MKKSFKKYFLDWKFEQNHDLFWHLKNAFLVWRRTQKNCQKILTSPVSRDSNVDAKIVFLWGLGTNIQKMLSLLILTTTKIFLTAGNISFVQNMSRRWPIRARQIVNMTNFYESEHSSKHSIKCQTRQFASRHHIFS